MRKFGIDISRWQDGFNFDKAQAEGVEFVILRGAYSKSKDKCFDKFYAACKIRNIPVGVYHYSMARTVAQAQAEANFLITNVLQGKQFEYPIYMDVEDKVQKALGKTLLTDIVIAFCEVLEKAGYYVGIYASASFFKSYLIESKLAAYDKWIAQWSTKCTYNGDYGMWQFGGETNAIRTNKIAGVVCDQDYVYKDYPAIIKSAKLNGYGQNIDIEEKPQEKPIETKKAKDSAKNFMSSLAGTYRVTGSALNIRHGAGILKGIMTTIPRNTVVKCYGYYSTLLGVKWLYIQFTHNGTIYSGFASSKYLRKV